MFPLQITEDDRRLSTDFTHEMTSKSSTRPGMKPYPCSVILQSGQQTRRIPCHINKVCIPLPSASEIAGMTRMPAWPATSNMTAQQLSRKSPTSRYPSRKHAQKAALEQNSNRVHRAHFCFLYAVYNVYRYPMPYSLASPEC